MTKKKYQIFISSTYEDLKEERDKAISCILELSHIPIGMEMFSADNDEQWKIIQETIDDSDYYLIIIGHKYGSLTKEGISYTEKEYDYALKKEIPILTFIQSDNAVSHFGKVESDPEKMKKLQAFREKSQKDKMCKFWKNSDELSMQISVSLSKIFKRTPRCGWVKDTSPEMLEEILTVNKENRALRQEIEKLKKSQVKRHPNIYVDPKKMIFQYQDIALNSMDYKERCRKLTTDDITDEIKDVVFKKDIEEYNKKLPNKEAVREYNYLRQIYYACNKKYYIPFPLLVGNDGDQKATDVRISFSVPKEVVILKKWKADHFNCPESIFPENPIDKAKNELYKSSISAFTSIMEQRERLMDFKPPLGLFETMDPDLLNRNKSKTIEFENNMIKISISDLLHKNYIDLQDDLVIIPLRRGNFNLEISTFCAEYIDMKEALLEITVE